MFHWFPYSDPSPAALQLPTGTHPFCEDVKAIWQMPPSQRAAPAHPNISIFTPPPLFCPVSEISCVLPCWSQLLHLCLWCFLHPPLPDFVLSTMTRPLTPSITVLYFDNMSWVSPLCTVAMQSARVVELNKTKSLLWWCSHWPGGAAGGRQMCTPLTKQLQIITSPVERMGQGEHKRTQQDSHREGVFEVVAVIFWNPLEPKDTLSVFDLQWHNTYHRNQTFRLQVQRLYLNKRREERS